MDLACGKETFVVDQNSKFSSKGEGFYRTFEQLSYWNTVKNGKQQLEFENGTENRSVASTIPVNGNGRSENPSINDEDIKSATMKKTIEE